MTSLEARKKTKCDLSFKYLRKKLKFILFKNSIIKYLFPKILKFNAKISIWWKLNVFDENSALL